MINIFTVGSYQMFIILLDYDSRESCGVISFFFLIINQNSSKFHIKWHFQNNVEFMDFHTFCQLTFYVNRCVFLLKLCLHFLLISNEGIKNCLISDLAPFSRLCSLSLYKLIASLPQIKLTFFSLHLKSKYCKSLKWYIFFYYYFINRFSHYYFCLWFADLSI